MGTGLARAGKHIVDVGGIKIEVDLATAKRIETYKIGDNIKILKKQYGDSFKSHPGVIVGFDRFEQRPTIVVAYLKADWNHASIDFEYITADSKDVEICHMSEAEKVIDKVEVVEVLDREISKVETQLIELKARKAYFLTHFKAHFEDNIKAALEPRGERPGIHDLEG